MTDQRYAELVERQAGVRELGDVLNSVRAIAASRAQLAREAIHAVDRYASGLVAALGQLADLLGTGTPATAASTALVVFGAEEGFAGAFSERLLRQVEPGELLFLVGSRAISTAGENRLPLHWSSAMTSHAAGVPRLADAIATALFAEIAAGRVSSVVVRHAEHRDSGSLEIIDEHLLPLDERALRSAQQRSPPLLQRPVRSLFDDLAGQYMHARLCRAALHSLAAESETRYQTMARARREIDRHLDALDQQVRMTRHEQITDEILELSAASPLSPSA